MAEPFIPENVTVHLGRPSNASAENVTVSFPDYIKNAASSELYPTWPESALRANIYAIISFTLNRIFTEWYPSQGYDFDITNSIQFDQSFVNGRDIYDPINKIVDEIFNDYIRRRGSIEPLFAVYCDGKEVSCDGLSQWGSVTLANQGYVPYNILTYYYGDDIDIVNNAAVMPNIPSYPGTPLSLGSVGNDVARIQNQLNRISGNYPAIPKIPSSGGGYDKATEDAVKAFQEIFNLPVTGTVDKATWYKINYIFVSVKKLSQLYSEGLTVTETAVPFPNELAKGSTGSAVRNLQYYLSVVGAYYNSVLPAEITGTFDDATENSVLSFQQTFGLPQTGVVNRETWDDLYDAYAGIVENVPINTEGANAVLFPGMLLTEGMTSDYIRIMQEYLTYIHSAYPAIPEVSATGYFGPVTKSAVTAFQKQFGLNPTGNVGADTWNSISDVYYELRYGSVKRPGQAPGYTIS
jgi:peptidoglycan hydrolase-like protein with peptidoglycan-binding domain